MLSTYKNITVSGKSLSISNISIALILFFTTISCKKNKIEKTEEIDNNLSISSIKFENGDLIYRNGNGAISQFFKKTSLQEQHYSHGGIISISNDSIYVIHTEASEITHIGGAKKETINSFLKNITQWGLYRIDTTQAVKNKIVSEAMQYVEKETPFDFDFDSSTEDKVYCTQLLSLSINKAMGREIIKTQENASLHKKYYAVDDTYLMPNAICIYRQDTIKQH